MEEESKLDEMLRLRRAPGVAGVETGPGSCSRELVFNRPDPAKDIPLTLRKMEEAGKFKNNPELARLADVKFKESKGKQYDKVDYAKGGHPLND